MQFGAFDSIAEKRQIFKVSYYRLVSKETNTRETCLTLLFYSFLLQIETIGDCYVAAAGLPRQRSDHAVLMARFAMECMVKMNEVTRKLEVHLGPDTGDLSLRAGFHSGPVTAGGT